MILLKIFRKYNNFITIDLINDNNKYKTQTFKVLHLTGDFFYKQSY